MSGQLLAPLEARFRPESVGLDLDVIGDVISAAEHELRVAAIEDEDRCCGYFPALAGMSAIRSDLPACRVFAQALPAISYGRMSFRFNFLRLSLVRQSADPAFHLDSDAATALTGDVGTLNEREVLRLLLNLSSRRERELRYLDVDPRATNLTSEGSYVRAEDPGRLLTRARVAVIPPRIGTTVHGLAFASNRVLHSGLDGGCCIQGSTASTDTSSPLTARRQPTAAEPVDALRKLRGTGREVRTEPPGAGTGDRRPAGGARPASGSRGAHGPRSDCRTRAGRPLAEEPQPRRRRHPDRKT